MYAAADQMEDQNPKRNEERGKQIEQKGEERCCLVREGTFSVWIEQLSV